MVGKKATIIVATTYIQRNSNDVLGIHRFKIHIKVKDVGGKTDLVLDGDAEKLVDTFAHKLVNIISKVRLMYRPIFVVYTGWTWSSYLK